MANGQSEYDLQCEIVDYLKENLIYGSLFTAFPLGGGGIRRGVKLKKSGTVAGWPDIQILHNGLYFGLEIKTEITIKKMETFVDMINNGNVEDILKYCRETKIKCIHLYKWRKAYI